MDLSKYVPNNRIQIINQLKRYLISRDLNKQIHAVKTILDSISSSGADARVVQDLISADIVELLCEATCTTNTILLQITFQCFSKFIECKAFFEQHHTVYTFESLQRTLHVLFRIDNEKETLRCGFQLVGDLIYRVKLNKIPLNNVCDVSNLLNLILSVLKSENSNSIILTVTKVVLKVLRSGDLAQVRELLAEVTGVLLDTLVSLSRSEDNNTTILSMAKLVASAMRFVNEMKEKTVSPQKNRNYDELLMKLNTVLKDILIPHLINMKKEANDREMLDNLLCCILSVYDSSNETNKLEFSNFIVSEGFLSLLPLIESQLMDSGLTVMVRSLLLELLICLSYDNLGKENWKILLFPGLECKPLGTSYNSIVFSERDINVPIAFIIYNYYYFLITSSPNVTAKFLQGLSRYIIMLEERPTFPLIKALWFTFAVGYVCYAEDVQQSRVALYKLVNLIMNSVIGSIYTHHPAILYWAFSDRGVPNELQTEVIKLWIQRADTKSVSILQSMLKLNADSLFLTLELLASCDSKTSEIINEILCSVLPQCSNLAVLYQHAWSTLPSLLWKYSSLPNISSCTDGLLNEGFAYFLKHCSDHIPSKLEPTLVLRISCLLPGAFSKYFQIALSNRTAEAVSLTKNESLILHNILNLITIILQIGMQMNDKRVSAPFLGRKSFLEGIQFLINVKDERVLTEIVQLLKRLILSQKETKQKSSHVIQLGGTTILQFLQGRAELCKAALKFLASYFEILSGKFEFCVVAISQPTELQLRSLYINIHMICAKSDDETASYCWLCLRKLLEFSETMGLKEHLASLPYTPNLLLQTTEPQAWKEATLFLSVWLKLIPRFSPNSLSSSISFEAVHKLISRLQNSSPGKQLIDKIKKIFLYEKEEGPQMMVTSRK